MENKYYTVDFGTDLTYDIPTFTYYDYSKYIDGNWEIFTSFADSSTYNPTDYMSYSYTLNM